MYGTYANMTGVFLDGIHGAPYIIYIYSSTIRILWDSRWPIFSKVTLKCYPFKWPEDSGYTAEQLQSAFVVSLVPDTELPDWSQFLVGGWPTPSEKSWLYNISYLAGGFNYIEKYDFVSWDDEIPNIWKVIKVMFQTTNQVQVLGQVATSFDVFRSPMAQNAQSTVHKKMLTFQMPVVEKWLNWTRKVQLFNQTKQSYKSKRTCHTMNGLKDPVLPAWLRVEKTMSKQTVVNPRYSPHQTYLIAVWMFVYPWVLLRKHPNLGRLTLVHIHTFYRSIWSFVSCWATFFVGCIMLYPIIPIYWPHPKLYLFNSHVCLVNPVGQAHPLWSRDHPRTQTTITCTHRGPFSALRSPAHAADNHMYTPASPRSHVHTDTLQQRSHVHTTTLRLDLNVRRATTPLGFVCCCTWCKKSHDTFRVSILLHLM